MRRVAFVVAVLGLLAPLAPRAADAGLYLGLRGAVAFPSGDVARGQGSVSSQVDVAAPAQGDAGWKFRNGLILGAYLRVAPGTLDQRVKDACDALPGSNDRCVAVDVGVGVQALYDFLPDRQLRPWVGGFLGWEVLSWRAAPEGVRTDLTYTGVELGGQGGLDFRLAMFTVGPYLQLGWGRFTDQTIDPEGAVKYESSIGDRAWHMWTTVGVKGGIAFK